MGKWNKRKKLEIHVNLWKKQGLLVDNDILNLNNTFWYMGDIFSILGDMMIFSRAWINIYETWSIFFYVFGGGKLGEGGVEQDCMGGYQTAHYIGPICRL